MKTKSTTILLVMLFFLSVLVFADNDKSAKTKDLSDCGCIDDFFDDGDSMYNNFQPWWIGPEESLPGHR